MKNTVNVSNLYDIEDARQQIVNLLENNGNPKIDEGKIKILAQKLLNRAFYSDTSEKIWEMCENVAIEVLEAEGYIS